MTEPTTPAERPRVDRRISYAQNMEDILLDRVFRGRPGTFVDVGANHPFVDSNTYYFYLRGWRGVNIEPNPSAQEGFLEYRPGDRNLSVAASDQDGSLKFFQVANNEGSTGLSTLDADAAARYRAEGYEVAEVDVLVRTLAGLITEHAIEPPDILSIDVEGHEAAVIRGTPWGRWQPKVLVVEATLPLSNRPSHEEFESILLDQGYLFAAFNGVNRFYLRADMAGESRHFATPVSSLDHYHRSQSVVLHERAEQYKAQLEQERAARAWDQAVAEQRRVACLAAQDQVRMAREAWERDRVVAARELALRQAQHEEAERRFAAERAGWNQQIEALSQVLADWEQRHASAQRQLRPYRLLDRFNLIGGGYGLARRWKRRLSSLSATRVDPIQSTSRP